MAGENIPVGVDAGGGDGLSGLFDHRIVSKPKSLETVGQWKEWRFETINYMLMVNHNFTSDMQLAEMERGEVDDTGDVNLRRRSQLLFAILASITKGRAKQIIMQLESTRNGYECWRRLCAEFQPQGTNHRLFALRELCKATVLQNKSETTYYSALLTWEEQIYRYESMLGDGGGIANNAPFAEDLKKAILLETCPEAIKVHLSLMPGNTTYAELRRALETFLRARGVWAAGQATSGHGGPQPMDIDAVISDNQCSRCGSTQHRSNGCPFWQAVC